MTSAPLLSRHKVPLSCCLHWCCVSEYKLVYNSWCGGQGQATVSTAIYAEDEVAVQAHTERWNGEPTNTMPVQPKSEPLQGDIVELDCFQGMAMRYKKNTHQRHTRIILFCPEELRFSGILPILFETSDLLHDSTCAEQPRKLAVSIEPQCGKRFGSGSLWCLFPCQDYAAALLFCFQHKRRQKWRQRLLLDLICL